MKTARIQHAWNNSYLSSDVNKPESFRNSISPEQKQNITKQFQFNWTDFPVKTFFSIFKHIIYCEYNCLSVIVKISKKAAEIIVVTVRLNLNNSSDNFSRTLAAWLELSTHFFRQKFAYYSVITPPQIYQHIACFWNIKFLFGCGACGKGSSGIQQSPLEGCG